MRLQPNNFIRLIKILRSVPFPVGIHIFKEGQTKTFLNFLSQGGAVFLNAGQWTAKLGSQEILLKRLSGHQFHILENLDAIEFSGWHLTLGPPEKIILRYDAEEKSRTLAFDTYESVLGMIEAFTEYESLEVRDKTVLDIGAFRGETALYFWARGAQKVLALEPYTVYAKEAESIVDRNNLSSMIIMLNGGIGSHVREFGNDTGNRCGVLMSIEDYFSWVRENKAKGTDLVLKIDCEGCEYDLFQDAESVAKWKALGIKEFVMEYHEGDLHHLVKNWRENGYHIFRVQKKDSEVGIIHGKLKSGGDSSED